MFGTLADKIKSDRYGGIISLVCVTPNSELLSCVLHTSYYRFRGPTPISLFKHTPDLSNTFSNTHFPGTQGLVFVIDSSDRERLDEARTELARIIQDREMKDALLLVFANKQDVPGAMRPDELSRRLRLDEIAKNHLWKVEPSCATTGEGIFEGLAWLGNNVKVPQK